MSDFDQILHGVAPVEVFRQLMASEPGLDKRELASRFYDFFDRVDSVAIHVIWHWQQPGGRPDLPDEGVNEQLIELLRRAGYEIAK